MNDFLGIDPPGDDIDTYLGKLTQAQLVEWRDYWIGMWTYLDRDDVITFVNQMYDKYYEEEPEPNVSFVIKDFYLNPSTVTDGEMFDWVTLIQNTGVTHEINCGMIFFYGFYFKESPLW